MRAKDLLIATWGSSGPRLVAVPAANAMALSLHVALDHHHEDTSHHPRADVFAAAHGHRHSEVVPDHQHSAPIPEATAVLKAVTGEAEMETLSRGEVKQADALNALDSRAGPPQQLFYSHCSLRL